MTAPRKVGKVRGGGFAVASPLADDPGAGKTIMAGLYIRELIMRADARRIGGRHVGHLPLRADTIQGWTFRRCSCGFVLAMSPENRVWWLRATSSAREITSFAGLIVALASNCRYHKPVAEVVAAAPASVAPTPAISSPTATASRAAQEPAPTGSSATIVKRPRRVKR